MKSPLPTTNNESYKFLTLFNCYINSITFNSGIIPEKDHSTIHLTATTKGDKTIQEGGTCTLLGKELSRKILLKQETKQIEILAHFWGKSANKVCTHFRKNRAYAIFGKELSRKILLKQETKQIELININVTRYNYKQEVFIYKRRG